MTAQQLKNSILQMAVQGKLVPQDPNDEPASVLLERIQAEKEELIKAGKIKKEKNPSVIFRGEDNLPYEKIGKNDPVCIADEVPCDIPDTWEWTRLSVANDMYTGNSINENEKKAKYMGLREGRFYIGTKDVSFSHDIEYDNGVRIPYDNDKFRIAPQNSILLCIEGGSAGRKIAFTNQDVCFGNKLCCFVSYGIDPLYLYYYLQCPLFQAAFKDNTSGIIGGVSVNVLKDMLLPVPPYKEQKRIVAEIEKIIPHIEKYDAKETVLRDLLERFPKQLKQSILQQAVMGKLVPQDSNDEPASILLDRIRAEKEALIKAGKLKKDKHESIIFKRDNSHYEKLDGVERCIDNEIPYDIPDSWEWARLSTIGYKITDGTHKTPLYVNDGIKFVSAQNIARGYLCFDKCKYITAKEHRELYQRCNPEKGDILISKSGSIGMAVINDASFEFSMFESLALLKYPHNHMYGDYLRIAIQSACWRLTDNEIRGVAVKHLPIASINRMLVPIPPLSEQQRIVSAYIKLACICDNINAGGI